MLDTAFGTGRARSQWFAERIRRAPVRLDARAARRLEEHLGEDMARLEGLLGPRPPTAAPLSACRNWSPFWARRAASPRGT